MKQTYLPGSVPPSRGRSPQARVSGSSAESETAAWTFTWNFVSEKRSATVAPSIKVVLEALLPGIEGRRTRVRPEPSTPSIVPLSMRHA